MVDLYILTFPQGLSDEMQDLANQLHGTCIEETGAAESESHFFSRFLFICLIKIQVQLTMREMVYSAKLKASNVTSNVYWHRWL